MFLSGANEQNIFEILLTTLFWDKKAGAQGQKDSKTEELDLCRSVTMSFSYFHKYVLALIKV